MPACLSAEASLSSLAPSSSLHFAESYLDLLWALKSFDSIGEFPSMVRRVFCGEAETWVAYCTVDG